MSSFTTLNKNNENARLSENDVKEFINRTRGELNKDKEKMDTLKKKMEILKKKMKTLKKKIEDLKVAHIEQEKAHEVAKDKVKELGNQLKVILHNTRLSINRNDNDLAIWTLAHSGRLSYSSACNILKNKKCTTLTGTKIWHKRLHSRPKISIKVVTWLKPNTNLFKLNVDGCSKGNTGRVGGSEAAKREEAMSSLAALKKKNENAILGPNNVEEVVVRTRGD
ncbi:hypothetical protein HAX54_013061 [Datura stramonium]|uniref:DRBM domain-containing protein n=1 Tax=Datura stramonium TaxID=4076 RepID=A0ABS8TKP9_DATST|nr:hypothetical protein [Datura stramonium]